MTTTEFLKELDWKTKLLDRDILNLLRKCDKPGSFLSSSYIDDEDGEPYLLHLKFEAERPYEHGEDISSFLQRLEVYKYFPWEIRHSTMMLFSAEMTIPIHFAQKPV